VLGTDYQEFYVTPGSSAVREVQSLEDLPRFHSFSEDSIALRWRAGAEFDDVFLLIVTVEDEVAPFDVIMSINGDDYHAAADSLLRSFGSGY